MPVMAVNNENPHEQTGDHRRELQVEAHRLAAWRDDFLEGGKQDMKGQRPDRSPGDRALKQAERTIGQLTMENEILRAPAVKLTCAGTPFRLRHG